MGFCVCVPQVVFTILPRDTTHRSDHDLYAILAACCVLQLLPSPLSASRSVGSVTHPDNTILQIRQISDLLDRGLDLA